MRQLYLDKLYWKTRNLELSFCSDVASKRVEKLKFYHQIRIEGCCEKTALAVIKISRATYFRWRKALSERGPKGLDPGSKRPRNCRERQWTRELQRLVCRLRTENPIYGRTKIHKIIKRDFPHIAVVSVTTIGRILKKLLELGKIFPVWALTGGRKHKRKRKFDKYAQRWKYGMKGVNPGELIQIDHMSVCLTTGKSIKHFQATCPVSKITVVQAYTVATSMSAAKFLRKVIAELPFEIKSIQVDGGSEFMKHFECACQAEEIPLYVLPPKSPQYNGCVERRNATFKYEFYYQYKGEDTIKEIEKALNVYQDRYNTYRPHQALNNDTPMQYYNNNYALVA